MNMHSYDEVSPDVDEFRTILAVYFESVCQIKGQYETLLSKVQVNHAIRIICKPQNVHTKINQLIFIRQCPCQGQTNPLMCLMTSPIVYLMVRHDQHFYFVMISTILLYVHFV